MTTWFMFMLTITWLLYVVVGKVKMTSMENAGKLLANLITMRMRRYDAGHIA